MAQFYQLPKKEQFPNTFQMENPVTNVNIRLATEADAESILKVYAPYIIGTTITFEYDVPTVEEFAQRLRVIRQTYPILVCELEAQIIGYAYAAVFKPRSAYQWTAESVVYFNQQRIGKGYGRILYEGLIDVLRLQGICQAIAVVTSRNQRSIDFHEKFGFKKSAQLQKVGYKFGEWLDVDWMQYQFAPLHDEPIPIKTIDDIKESDAFRVLLSDINRKINL